MEREWKRNVLEDDDGIQGMLSNRVEVIRPREYSGKGVYITLHFISRRRWERRKRESTTPALEQRRAPSPTRDEPPLTSTTHSRAK